MRDEDAEMIDSLNAELVAALDRAIFLERDRDQCAKERDALRAALERIAGGNPASPSKWLTDIEMAEIARAALAAPQAEDTTHD